MSIIANRTYTMQTQGPFLHSVKSDTHLEWHFFMIIRCTNGRSLCGNNSVPAKKAVNQCECRNSAPSTEKRSSERKDCPFHVGQKLARNLRAANGGSASPKVACFPEGADCCSGDWAGLAVTSKVGDGAGIHAVTVELNRIRAPDTFNFCTSTSPETIGDPIPASS